MLASRLMVTVKLKSMKLKVKKMAKSKLFHDIAKFQIFKSAFPDFQNKVIYFILKVDHFSSINTLSNNF